MRVSSATVKNLQVLDLIKSTHEQNIASMNIKFLPQVDSGRQISSVSLFLDKLFIGLTWPADQQPVNAVSMLKLEKDADDYRDVTGSELFEQGVTANNIFWQAGCHSMAVFSRNADTPPVLYASLLSPSGCKLAMTRDGENIEVLPSINDDVLVRSMVAFNGRLFAATYNSERLPVVYCSDDPASGTWERACEPGFSDSGNISITSMTEFNGSLYVALLNPTGGFQLWRTTTDDNAPYSWKQVISQGAQRYTQNPGVLSMATFDGALYLGTGPFDTAVDSSKDNIAAAELIQVFPDDSWDIVVGSPRFSPTGLKVPMAAMGPGFDSRKNTRITAMAEHQGRLYVTTSGAGQVDRTLSNSYRLWSTADGEEWSAVSTGNPDTRNALTVRVMITTPENLLLASSESGHYDLFTDAAIILKHERSAKEPSLLRFAKKLLHGK